jgi:hypothetical protein
MLFALQPAASRRAAEQASENRFHTCRETPATAAGVAPFAVRSPNGRLAEHFAEKRFSPYDAKPFARLISETDASESPGATAIENRCCA